MFYLRTLDDTAWSIADVTGPIGTGTHIFDINFTANDQEYNSIRFVDGADSGQVYFDATLVNEYPRDGWVDTAYQNVKIAGGVDATNPSLLSWFRQNAKNLTPSNDDASITKALQDIAEAISGRSGGGGMPADYPYEVTTLFDGNVEYVAAGAANIEVALPKGEPLTITINGVTTDLFWDEDGDLWSNVYPYDEDNSDTEVGYNADDSTWIWMRDASDGTYAVKIEGNSIDENFASAVKEIISETEGSSGKAFFEADLTTEPQPYSELLLEDHPLAICKAYINGIETPILYQGVHNGSPIWQIETESGATHIAASIGFLNQNAVIAASEPCHIAIAESSDTNIVIPSNYNGSGYPLLAAPEDIMNALRRQKYSFSLAVRAHISSEAPDSYGTYPLTFEYYYNGSVPELHAQSLMMFGTAMNGAVDAEHGVFIFSADSGPEN